MKVFVTGVAGFLGSRVARLFLEKGWEVEGCDNLLTGKEENVPKGVTFFPVSVQEYRGAVAASVIVHAAAIARSAWPNEDDLWEHNVNGTIAALDLWHNGGVQFVYCSSCVVDRPNSSVYARTKEVGERLVLASGGVALRFGNIYGPGQNEEGPEPNVIASMKRALRETGAVRVDGTGRQSRRFVHVDDAANAVWLAYQRYHPGVWMDIATKDEISINALAARFDAPITYGPTRNDPHVIRQDTQTAKWLIGWEPTVPLDTGLKEVIG